MLNVIMLSDVQQQAESISDSRAHQESYFLFRRFSFLLPLLLSSLHAVPLVKAEIVDLTNVVLTASSYSFEYTEATVLGGPSRARINIEHIVLRSPDYLPNYGNLRRGSDDDEAYDDDIAYEPIPSTVDDKMEKDDWGGGERQRSQRQLDDMANASHGGSVVDIVLFELPAYCANTKEGCSWPSLGIGTYAGGLAWCCDAEAVEMGICENSTEALGRLIVTKNFTGFHRSVNVPAEGEMTETVEDGDFRIVNTGKWVVALANCNERGRDVVLTGYVVFESEGGYLPGELFPYMYFSIAITAIYAVLFFWYLCLMRKYASARIPIEKWILATIAIGLLEMCFRTADYVLWNMSGLQNLGVAITAIMIGVFKHALARCLVLMVSLGWGVTTDRLRKLTMCCIVILAAVYAAVGATADIYLIVSIEKMKTISLNEEIEMLDRILELEYALYLISIAFVLWTIFALIWTMLQLRNTSQTRKLRRYWGLTGVLLLSYVASVAVMYIDNANPGDSGVERFVGAAAEAIFLFMLIGVSCLWRPSESAREYAYAMQLSSNEVGSDLELSAVPSVADESTSGYYSNGVDARFSIDDGDGPRIT
jgi:hypothetical protein